MKQFRIHRSPTTNRRNQCSSRILSANDQTQLQVVVTTDTHYCSIRKEIDTYSPRASDHELPHSDIIRKSKNRSCTNVYQQAVSSYGISLEGKVSIVWSHNNEHEQREH